MSPQEIRVLEDSIEETIPKESAHKSDVTSVFSLFAPVSLLPTEVLSEIFIMVQTELEHQFSNSCGMKRPWKDVEHCKARAHMSHWLFMAHICRFWREVVLDTPRLWTQVIVSNYTNRDYLDVLLSHSNQAPLTVTVDLPWVSTHVMDDRDWVDTVFEKLSEQQHRIRAMILRSPFFEWMFRFEGWDMPSIKSLQYTGFGTSIQDVPSIQPSFSRIEHLTINVTISRLLPQSICALLESLPMLVTFEVDDCGDPSVTEPPESLPDDHVVTLTRLQSFKLSTYGHILTGLLDHVHFPQNTLLDISCKRTATLDESVEQQGMIPALVSVLNQLAAPFVRLSIYSLTSGMVRIDGWTDVFQPPLTLFREHTSVDGSQSLAFRISLPSYWQYILEDFVCAFSPAVETMYVADWKQNAFTRTPPLPYNSWLNSFGWMSNLQTLLVSGTAAYNLPAALVKKELRVVFPWLRVLELDHVRFVGWKGEECHDFVGRLANALLERKEQLAPVEELRITDAGSFSQADIELLKSIVPIVEWTVSKWPKWKYIDHVDYIYRPILKI